MKAGYRRLGPLFLAALLLMGGLYFLYPREADAAKIVRRALQKHGDITSYYTFLETGFNQGDNTCAYVVEIWFNAPHCYRVEISPCPPGGKGEPEQVFIGDGETTWIISPELGEYYRLNPLSREIESPPFLLLTFLKRLSKAREVELEGVEKKERGSYFILRVVPEHPGRNHTWERVWLEKNTLLPVQIHIYDLNDQLQQTIIFRKTILNLDLSPELFQPPIER